MLETQWTPFGHSEKKNPRNIPRVRWDLSLVNKYKAYSGGHVYISIYMSTFSQLENVTQ